MRGPSDVFARILPFSFPLLLPLPLPLSPGRANHVSLAGVIGGGAIALPAFPQLAFSTFVTF